MVEQRPGTGSTLRANNLRSDKHTPLPESAPHSDDAASIAAKKKQGHQIVERYLETSRRNLPPTTNTSTAAPAKPRADKKLDEFGFIVNMNNHGSLYDDDEEYMPLPGGAYTPPPGTLTNSTPTQQHSKKNPMRRRTQSKDTPRSQKRTQRAKTKLRQRREKKWLDMLQQWEALSSLKKKKKKLRSRIRKGIPNSIRGRAWARLANVPVQIHTNHVGLYLRLVEESCDPHKSSSGSSAQSQVVSSLQGGGGGTDAMKDTIERDIGRTFPRHSMFYDSASDSSSFDADRSVDDSFDRLSLSGSMEELPPPPPPPSLPSPPTAAVTNGSNTNPHESDSYHNVELELSESNDSSSSQGGAHDDCWSKSVLVLEKAAAGQCPPFQTDDSKGPLLEVPPRTTPTVRRKKRVDFTSAEGGQASLRRVLRAYNAYDPEVGYCQGMNFIAGMFITYMSEEEAFWLLVHVMNDAPCRMRGLFTEGMKEAHQVLYVAEKLIAQFNPKLSRHFDKEGVHISMFVTQWLLTMYTSSFPFHFVTRVWDCFLSEGWKVAYRVMLALLERASGVLMKLRFEDILEYFKELPTFVNGDTVLEHAFKIPLKKRHIEKYAKEWEANSS